MVVKLDLNEIFQISMNGPSLNLIFLEKLQKNRKKKKNIGNPGFYTLHSTFKYGANSTSWILKAIISGSYQILHDSPARREDI